MPSSHFACPADKTALLALAHIEFSLGDQSLDFVIDILQKRGYGPCKFTGPLPATDKNELLSRQKKSINLMLQTDIDPHWIVPFGRWLMRKALLKQLKLELVDSEGEILAAVQLYCTGNNSF
ncbi:hypothetical protein O4H49_10080 [Kiloniella laminariae]|uniref:Uncharacterized protein n=1 Tax=Kiloniella laminariae TaxID=454162 RepID=A0ABT4LJ41_9PROT|nr:hypothetical protein [Kiloniella laminariae]MCZ4281126.1 hypothetical protein [Kiloniella laminariae]